MGRVPYWNINHGWLIDFLSIPVMALVIYGLCRHWKSVNRGRVRRKLGISITALKIGPIYIRSFLIRGLLGSRLYNKLGTGIAHGLVFWGMVLLFIGTILVFANVLFDLPVFAGLFNQWFMGFALDSAGVIALVGTLFLLVKRILSEDRLVIVKTNSRFVQIELAILAILITGFLVEAFRIAQTGNDSGSYVGNWIGSFLRSVENVSTFHQYVWWIHGILALALLAYIPFSPLVHLILVPLNTGLTIPVPGTKMGVIDFEAFGEEDGNEDPPCLGVGKLSDFSWKNLLDSSTCLWCGRCQEVCPTVITGKDLSPKKVMVSLAEYLEANKMNDESLIDTISSDNIYSCTTCAACIEACPASINPTNAILGMRQYLLMERSLIPKIMGQAHKSLEARQHPFVGTGFGQDDWRKGIKVPLFEKNTSEYLLWIGCAVSYEERTQNIARSMVNILKNAGVSFGILEENRCTGDPAKQMGNEYLFTEIASQNIDEFNSLGVKNIITICPHCYNSFTEHYPLLGGNFKVVPHAVFLHDLINSGAIKLKKAERTICYHDPCYFGRHNNILTEPRNVISSVGQLVEMPRSGLESFCCGGGGGNYWTEEAGTRINKVRAQEAIDMKTDLIATACPFCLLMLTDGVKSFTEEPMVYDIAEIISTEIDIL